MTERVSLAEFDREVAAFQVRLQELRTQRLVGGEGGDEAAAAAFLELETAAEELRVAHEELWVSGNELARRTAPNDRDRDVLRVVFRDLPLAVILLDRSGRIRRVNQRAVDLLGATADYLSGKPFPVFVDLPGRAALRSHLAAVARGKEEQVIAVSLLRQGARVHVQVALSTVQVPADSRPVIMAVVLADELRRPADGPALAPADHARPWADRPQAVRAATERVDLVTEVTRLLLRADGASDAVVLHGLATLLCGRFAEWVSVDRLSEGRLTRASVCGPASPGSEATLGTLERAVVGKAELPRGVVESGQSRLEAHVDDQSIFGDDDRGVPFLVAMGAHSVLCVPIEADGHRMGALTALRGRDREPFSLAEQGALEDVGGLLGLALRERQLPRRAAHVPADGSSDVLVAPGGPPELQSAVFLRAVHPVGPPASDILDVYPGLTGWGAFLVDGPDGEASAAYLSMVRQWARLLGLTTDDPAALLTQLNWAMGRLGMGRHPVAANAVHIDVTANIAPVRLASAGHSSSLILRADGRVERTDGGGQPLTGGEPVVLHEAAPQLHRGDLLLLYNDALVDTRDSTGAGFGQSGQLRMALARAADGTAQEAVDTVAKALHDFADAGLQHNVAAAGIKFTGR